VVARGLVSRTTSPPLISDRRVVGIIETAVPTSGWTGWGARDRDRALEQERVQFNRLTQWLGVTQVTASRKKGRSGGVLPRADAGIIFMMRLAQAS